MAKAARIMKVVKIGEVKITNYEVTVGYDGLDYLLKNAFPAIRNLTDPLVFNGKITIIIDEFEDEQPINTFALPENKEEVNE